MVRHSEMYQKFVRDGMPAGRFVSVAAAEYLSGLPQNFQRTGQAPIAVLSIGSKSMSNSRTARRQGAGWDEEHCLGSFRLQAGKKLSCVSLFSGCGGLELGLRR